MRGLSTEFEGVVEAGNNQYSAPRRHAGCRVAGGFRQRAIGPIKDSSLCENASKTVASGCRKRTSTAVVSFAQPNRYNHPDEKQLVFHSGHLLGAARTVTGSMHLVEVNGISFAARLRVISGKRSDARQRIAPSHFGPATLAGGAEHAHIDHCGNLLILRKSPA